MDATKIIGREEAKSLGLKRYFTGEPCKHGHVCERYIFGSSPTASVGRCVECVIAIKIKFKEYYQEYSKKKYIKEKEEFTRDIKKWREENKEKAKQSAVEWEIRNKEKRKAQYLEWYSKNKEVIAEKDKARRAKDLEKFKERAKKYRQSNLEKDAAKSARRRASQLKRTPIWLTKEQQKQIDVFYAAAAKAGLTVDHVIPLKGKTVSGLHVPWNLQLLTKSENCQKRNKLIYA